jgi:hypothetical protein
VDSKFECAEGALFFFLVLKKKKLKWVRVQIASNGSILFATQKQCVVSIMTLVGSL